MAVENVPGGFSAVYDVLKAMEERGRIRRGYFVAGLGATQFALPAARRPAAVAARRARNAADRLPRRHGSGQPVRRDPEVAGRRREQPGPMRSRARAARPDAPGGRRRHPGERRRWPRTWAAQTASSSRSCPRTSRAQRCRRRGRPHAAYAWRPAAATAPACSLRRSTASPRETHPLAPFLVEAGFIRRPTGFQAAPPRES